MAWFGLTFYVQCYRSLPIFGVPFLCVVCTLKPGLHGAPLPPFWLCIYPTILTPDNGAHSPGYQNRMTEVNQINENEGQDGLWNIFRGRERGMVLLFRTIVNELAAVASPLLKCWCIIVNCLWWISFIENKLNTNYKKKFSMILEQELREL